MTDKIKMKVEMEVTIPQALALQAMFEHWNKLGSRGSSKHVSFFVDGDGNFQPRCTYEFSDDVPELTPELAELAVNEKCLLFIGHSFDFDAIAWKINHE